jgi:hypothetical protein
VIAPYEPLEDEDLADRLPPLVEFADSLQLEVLVE